MAEDREAFRDLLDRIDQPYAPSSIVEGPGRGRAARVGGGGPRRDRPARDHPAGVHARRHRRRHRRHRGGLLGARPGGPPGEPDQAGDDRALPRRLAGDRVRGHARRRGHVHRRVLDGERRPAGRPHGRLDRRRAGPDADRPGPPAAAQRGPRDHPRARRRGRLQRPVRALARLDRVRGDRGQPARVALVRAGLEGHGLPDRPRRGADRGRADAGRDPQRRHRHHGRRLRARARLRRRQAAALPVRQVPDRRPAPRLADEGDRRGDGDRPDLRGGAEQGAPRPRAGGCRAARRGPVVAADVRLPRRRVRGRRSGPMPRRGRRRRRRRSAGSTSAATPARAPASPSAPPRRSCSASSSSRPTRGCGGCSGCSGGASPRRRSARPRGSRPGSSPRWAATSGWRRTCARPGPGSRIPPTRTARACSPPPSARASPTATSRRWPGWGRRRSAPPGARSASSPATRWSTPAPPSSRPRRRTSTRPTRRPARRPRRRPSTRPAALVIGSGPVRIGQGIEFDYCAVQAADVLRREGWSAVMVNSNPETVSTDFDASTRLYFEPLDAESVLGIVTFESGGRIVEGPDAIGRGTLPAVVAFGGQTPLNLAAPLVAGRRAAARLEPRDHRPGRGAHAVLRAARPPRHPAARGRHGGVDRGGADARRADRLPGHRAPVLRHRRARHRLRVLARGPRAAPGRRRGRGPGPARAHRPLPRGHRGRRRRGVRRDRAC